MLKVIVCAFSLGTVGATVYAQVAAVADMQKLQATMMAAQAAAVRPGDEAISCPALQKELVSTMNDPSIQTYAAKTNATYAKDLAAREKTKTGMTAEAAAALVAALAGGMSPGVVPPMPGVPGQAMTPQQMQQAMLAQQQASIAYMNQLAPIMPALMRSQRLTMLAFAKNCAWATGLGLAPGVVAPR